MRVVAALLVVVALAAGCGGDPIESYCKSVKDHQTELSDALAEGGSAGLLAALPVFEDLEDEAPSDIKDEWETVTDALGALEDALDDAGVDPASYDPKDPPEGLTEAERQRIEAAATELTSPQTTAALAAVEQQARDVCETPLFL